MKRLSNILLVALLALAGPTIVRADTVYFSKPGTSGIKSISGTIVQENDSHVEIKAEDGHSVSIPKSNVFQIIRDTAGEGGAPQGDVFKATRESASYTEDWDPDLDWQESPSNSHYGIKGGMNISNMSVDPQQLEDHDSLKSFAVGAWWGRPIRGRLGFRTEALYSVKGDAESAGGYTASTHMSYLDVPVLAKIGFLHDQSFQPSLFLGPAVSLNLTAKSSFEGGGSSNEIDVKDQVNPLDVGLVVGGGLDFPVGGRSYGVELRYSKGLTNAANDEANGSAHNDVITVLASIGLK